MSAWRKKLKALIRRMPDEQDGASKIVNEIYHAPGDRGAALVAGTFAEDALAGIIRARLVPLSNEKLEELFGFDGTLRSFADKIRVAYAFGFIDSEIRNDLDRIREVRNVFAHARTDVSFSTPEIVAACRGFHAPDPIALRSADDQNSPSRAAYAHATLMIVILGNALFEWLDLGHFRKARRPLSYAALRPSLDRYLRQARREIRQSPPPGNTPPAPEDQP
jgi:hypothetical protein